MALYNLRNPAVKRLMKEAEELRCPTVEYYAQPLEDNLFEWHFTVRGPPKTDFEGGIYHGRITLPTDYPMKPPSIILLTPNGRFEINKKICLSISGHHPESWRPSWSIRTALLAIIGFMPTHGNGAIGSLEYTPEERQLLALKSQEWKCTECGLVQNFLKKDDSCQSSNVENEPEIGIDAKTICLEELSEDAVCDTSSLAVKDSISSNGSILTHRDSSIKTDFSVQKEENVKSLSSSEGSNLVLRCKTTNILKEKTVLQPSQPVAKKNFPYSSILIWVLLLIIIILFVRRITYS
ncbi:ubiquitin-conjugating enzyme E2 J1-like [Uloborus diversus]|uniref:ubiquitin-conjugating enzyme E2 J1-like n=1 Tax=Uloborus diversus TaxID=327109 RepID=UPI00240A0ED9|nr:ubiquitin-conjugating enzyme E2 J1-like [Uloborus diversus]